MTVMTNRLFLAAILIAALGTDRASRAGLDLDAFVKRTDPSYAWKVVETKSLPGGVTAHQIRLTSQTWQGSAWTHDLQIYEPAEVKYPDHMLLFITGGANKIDNPVFRHSAEGLAFVKACGSRVAVLPQVPNQPLLGGKVEDDLIAETFVRYLETKDDTLPLLQPMVKSAVKAMDAVQEWSKQEGRPVPKGFVVTGASKRGWTTWLTGAVDPRVIAIAPMVIPTLNMKAQNKHQLDSWGKYSEQIEDYTRRGLLEDLDKPDRHALWKLIDPFTYRDRLTMPKLQINGTNDPYWTLDSMNIFWDDLKGPKYVVYLPNAGHGLDQHREWAVNGVGALFRHAVTGRAMPALRWEFDPHYTVLGGERFGEGQDDRVCLTTTIPRSDSKPKGVDFWTARSKDQDFRQVRWKTLSEIERGPGEAPLGTEVLHPEIRTRGEILRCPDSGYAAMFADYTFEIDGLEYHLSSQIFLFGPTGGKQ